MSNYIDERDLKYSEKLQKIIRESLPSFCREFFIGIAMNTTILTRYNYSNDLKIFFEFTIKYGSVFEGKNIKEITLNDLNDITTSDLEEFLVYIDNYLSSAKKQYRNKDQAKARKFCSVRSMFRYFYLKDKISQNVTLKVNMPKIRDKEIVRLENSEAGKVLDCFKNNDTFASSNMNNYNNNNTKQRDFAIVTLLLGTGIRISECVGLNLSDIDFINKTFLVTRKGEKRSILYLNDDIISVLKFYINNDREKQVLKKIDDNAKEAIFISLQGKRISVRAVENLVKKYTKSVTPLKNITPHKLRATFGTELYRATQDIYVVAEVLGHKDINTTRKHYAAISDDIKKKASNVVKYDE